MIHPQRRMPFRKSADHGDDGRDDGSYKYKPNNRLSNGYARTRRYPSHQKKNAPSGSIHPRRLSEIQYPSPPPPPMSQPSSSEETEVAALSYPDHSTDSPVCEVSVHSKHFCVFGQKIISFPAGVRTPPRTSRCEDTQSVSFGATGDGAGGFRHFPVGLYCTAPRRGI
jgi:hypothetical protein